MIYEPYADALAPISTSQLDLVDALQPDIVVSIDLVANDLVAPILLSSDLDITMITPVDDLQDDLVVALDRLEASGADVFLADVPDPALLPATEELRRQVLAQAEDQDAEEAAFAVRLSELRTSWAAYNALLRAQAALRPHIHVVDFAAQVEALVAEPVQIGDTTLTLHKLGGLFSTDGVHLGDVGNAVLANGFAEAINAKLGTQIPAVDLSEILATDPYSPAALLADGLDVTACQ
jgi:hypothetical protein